MLCERQTSRRIRKVKTNQRKTAVVVANKSERYIMNHNYIHMDIINIHFGFNIRKFVFVCFQKWSKGKTRDKLNNLILFDKATYDKFLKEVPSYKLITPSVVSERLKVRGSLARAALKELVAKSKFIYFVFCLVFN